MKLIIGLGNPGEEYTGTRHNVGWMVLDKLAQEAGAELAFDKKMNAAVAKGKLNGKPMLLAKPDTFVNESGEAAKKLKLLAKAKPTDIIIVHDDLDIEFGNWKLSFGKNAGGHHGVESVIKALKTKDLWRLKIGIANKKLAAARRDDKVADFVLAKFSPAEQERLKLVFKQVLARISQQN